LLASIEDKILIFPSTILHYVSGMRLRYPKCPNLILNHSEQ